MTDYWFFMKNRIIRAVMALLGFVSFTDCITNMYGPEYGEPKLRRLIEGTVTDQKGNPIPGIRVRDSYTGMSVTTNTSGKVEMEIQKTGTQELPEFDLYFEDPDGPENGGAFAADTLYFKDMKIKQVTVSGFEISFEKQLHPAPEGE